MKRIIIIPVLLSALFSLSFVQETMELLIPGVGIENYVTINATTKNEIIVKYGSGYKEIKHYSEAKAGARPGLVSIEHQYKNQGISFYYRPDRDTVFSIHVSAPFKGKTAKGIILGQSTLQDAEDAYGKADIYEADDKMFTEYAGIRFYVNKGKGLTEAQIMQQKIVKIAIIEIKP